MTEGEPAGGTPRVPANADEALAIARTVFAPRLPDGSPAPLEVHEFDVGYLVHVSFPPERPAPPSAPRRPRTNPGGRCVVVAKETGEVRTLPHRPKDAAVALYRKTYRPDTLLPPDAREPDTLRPGLERPDPRSHR